MKRSQVIKILNYKIPGHLSSIDYFELINIYTSGRCFIQSDIAFLLSLRIEPITLVLLAPWSIVWAAGKLPLNVPKHFSCSSHHTASKWNRKKNKTIHHLIWKRVKSAFLSGRFFFFLFLIGNHELSKGKGHALRHRLLIWDF